MIEAESFDPLRDVPNVSEISFGKDNKLLIRRQEPYGFYTIRSWKGPTPKELEGAFTSYDYAFNHANRYLEKKQ
jgi:hypothetical protein